MIRLRGNREVEERDHDRDWGGERSRQHRAWEVPKR